MSNIQEDALLGGGNPLHERYRELLSQIEASNSNMDVQSVLNQILPVLSRITGPENGNDIKLTHVLDLIGRLDSNLQVLGPLLEAIHCMQVDRGEGGISAISGMLNDQNWSSVGGGGDNSSVIAKPQDTSSAALHQNSQAASLAMVHNLLNKQTVTDEREGAGSFRNQFSGGDGYRQRHPSSSSVESYHHNMTQMSPLNVNTSEQSHHPGGYPLHPHGPQHHPQMSPLNCTTQGQGRNNFAQHMSPPGGPPGSASTSPLFDPQKVEKLVALARGEGVRGDGLSGLLSGGEHRIHGLEGMRATSPNHLQLIDHISETSADEYHSPQSCNMSPNKPFSPRENHPHHDLHQDPLHDPHHDLHIKQEDDCFDQPEYDAAGLLVTSSGRNRGLGKANEPRFSCQVCGDVAAGFHCGAYVCEACKKFYLRCLKNGGSVAYSCPKTQECSITKETRSHCQFCRYQKCNALGMYKPGRDDSKHLRVDFKSIPCKVCNAPSSGFHFGAITCEGCKGFFRRMVKEKLHKKFVCTAGGGCDVASSNRTACKACRYHKCLDIGMALEGTRLGRQSNSVKRNTLIQYLNSGIDVSLFPDNASATAQPNSKVDMVTSPSNASMITPVDIPDLVNVKKEETMDDSSYGRYIGGKDLMSPGDHTTENNSSHTGGKLPPPHGKTMDYLSLDTTVTRGNPFCGGPSSGLNQSSNLGDKQRNFPWNTDNFISSFMDESSDGMSSLAAASLNGSGNYNNRVSRLKRDSASSDGDPLLDHPLSRKYQKTEPPGAMLSPSTSDSSQPLSAALLSPVPQPGESSAYHRALQRTASTDHQGTNPPAPHKPPPNREEKLSGEECRALLIQVIRAYRELEYISKRKREPITMEKTPQNEKSLAWWAAYESFMHQAKYTLRFVKKIPGFKELDMEDQITLVRESVYPITLLHHAQFYQPNLAHKGWFCNTEQEKNKILSFFPKFKILETHLEYTGRLFKQMNLSLEDNAFMCALMVFTIDSFLVKDAEAIQAIQNNLCDAFFHFCTETDTDLNRPGLIILRLSELKRANFEHTQIAIETQRENPDVDFSQLWHEMFLTKLHCQ